MWKVHLDNLSRQLGEEGNPLHSPDVSSTRLRGGLDTTSKKHVRYWATGASDGRGAGSSSLGEEGLILY